MHSGLIPVDSSNLAGYRHLPGNILLVAFKQSGDVYRYDGVEKDLANGLAAAASKGGFLNAVIKKGGFPYRKLDPEEVDELFQKLGSMSQSIPPRRRRQSGSGIPPELLERYPFLRAVV